MTAPEYLGKLFGGHPSTSHFWGIPTQSACLEGFGFSSSEDVLLGLLRSALSVHPGLKAGRIGHMGLLRACDFGQPW